MARVSCAHRFSHSARLDLHSQSMPANILQGDHIGYDVPATDSSCNHIALIFVVDFGHVDAAVAGLLHTVLRCVAAPVNAGSTLCRSTSPCKSVEARVTNVGIER